MKKTRPAFDDLRGDEIQGLLRSARKDEVTKSVPLLNGEEEDSIFAFWLHAQIKRDCYYFCTVYRYKVWVTTDKAGKEKIEVKELRLRISRNGGKADYDQISSNISECSYLEEVYGRESHSRPKTLTATAKLFGRSREVDVSL